MMGAPVVLELGCVVFNAANVKFSTLSEPTPGNAEQESILDCLATLRAEVAANKEKPRTAVAKDEGRTNITMSFQRWNESGE